MDVNATKKKGFMILNTENDGSASWMFQTKNEVVAEALGLNKSIY